MTIQEIATAALDRAVADLVPYAEVHAHCGRAVTEAVLREVLRQSEQERAPAANIIARRMLASLTPERLYTAGAIKDGAFHRVPCEPVQSEMRTNIPFPGDEPSR